MLFEGFSHTYEKVFRTIFIIWASVWLFINFFEIAYQYSVFDQIYYENRLVGWVLDTISTIISFSIGIALLAMMIAIPYKIAKSEKIQFFSLMQTIAVFYYLFLTLVRLFVDVIYSTNRDATIKTLVFSAAWLFPSIVMMVFHFIYFHNLSKYVEFIENKSAANNQATNSISQ
jgi:hypothetical protein